MKKKNKNIYTLLLQLFLANCIVTPILYALQIYPKDASIVMMFVFSYSIALNICLLYDLLYTKKQLQTN